MTFGMDTTAAAKSSTSVHLLLHRSVGKFSNTGTLFCLTTCITFHSERSVWPQAAQISLLFQYPVCRGYEFWFVIVLLTLGFYSSYVRKVLETASFSSQTHHAHTHAHIHICVVHCLAKVNTPYCGCIYFGSLIAKIIPIRFILEHASLTNKKISCMGSGLTNEETAFPPLFIPTTKVCCTQQFSLKIIRKQEVCVIHRCGFMVSVMEWTQ